MMKKTMLQRSEDFIMMRHQMIYTSHHTLFPSLQKSRGSSKGGYWIESQRKQEGEKESGNEGGRGGGERASPSTPNFSRNP